MSIDCAGGLAATVKSELAIVRMKVVERVREPLVPIMLILYEPSAREFVPEMSRFEPPHWHVGDSVDGETESNPVKLAGATAESVTVPEKPLLHSTCTAESSPENPAKVVTWDGLTAMEKSPRIVKETVPLWDREPLVPVMTMLYFPEDDPWHDMVELPDPFVMPTGLKTHAGPDGFVVADRETVPENPFTADTVIVAFPGTFGLTVRMLGLAEIAKSGTALTL
jgi:hypothetical protein